MILCSGAFDGLHAGHLAYLQAAANIQPEWPLVVAVAPDAYIRRQKGREPRWSQADRVATVAGLRLVTRVVTQETQSVASVIRTLKPALFVKGIDWLGHLPTDVAHACVESGACATFVDTERTHGSAVAW